MAVADWRTDPAELYLGSSEEAASNQVGGRSSSACRYEYITLLDNMVKKGARALGEERCASSGGMMWSRFCCANVKQGTASTDRGGSSDATMMIFVYVKRFFEWRQGPQRLCVLVSIGVLE